MQRRRIKVCAVWPGECADLGIQRDLIEDREILKRPKQSSLKDWSQINVLRGPVSERDVQHVRPDDPELRDPVNWMAHELPKWFDLDWWLPRLQELPIMGEFVTMNFGPSLDHPPLWHRQLAA
jgi:hypothetical protein